MNLLSRFALGAARLYSRLTPTQRGGYRIARLTRRLIPRSNWRDRYHVANIALDLDLATYPDCCMAIGVYELDTLRLLRRLLTPGDHFVDVGANIGYFALHAAGIVGPSGHVDAFEPDPINRARLESNLSANCQPPHIRVHAIAASDRAGEATLYHPANDANHNHGEASFFTRSGQPYTVTTARLDQHLERVPALVKMDIEGAEMLALQGATGWLGGTQPPTWIIEHNPASSAAAGHRPGELLRFMQRQNARYAARWIGWRSKAVDAERIVGFGVQGNILYCVEAAR
jgi:FkbM family methyltransferase